MYTTGLHYQTLTLLTKKTSINQSYKFLVQNSKESEQYYAHNSPNQTTKNMQHPSSHTFDFVRILLFVQIDIVGEGSTQDTHIQRLDVPLLYNKPVIIASKHFPKVRFSKPRIVLALAATVSTCVFQDRSD